MIFKYFFKIASIIIAISLVKTNAKAQALLEFSHDSIMSLNKKAFSLIYSNPDSAFLLANKAYEISLHQNDSIAIVESISTIAGANWAEAKYNIALKLYFEALSKYENLGDTTGILRSYNNIGVVYEKLKNYSIAKKYTYKYKKLHHSYLKDKYPTLNYLHFAELFLEEKQYDSAAFYLDKAKRTPDNQLTINQLATINYDYAVLTKNTTNFELAKTYIEQSIYFAQLQKNDRRLAEAYNVLGEILFSTNKRDEAIKYFEGALALAIKLHHEQLELALNKNLYLAELEKGNTLSAITHVLRYAELKDKIYAISISRQLAEFETVHQLEQIENENSLLQLKQSDKDRLIKHQIGFLIFTILALLVAVYFILTINKQRKILKMALALLEEKSKIVDLQKQDLQKQSLNSEALNLELTLLNKNLESRAQKIAHEIEDKNKKMNQYAFINAHKLRAPIASILGLINLFDKNIGKDHEKTMIELLKNSADKLDKVVHEIKIILDE